MKYILVIYFIYIITSLNNIYRHNREEFKITVFNVGQGDAIEIEIKNKYILIDAGNDNTAEWKINHNKYLYKCRIDYAFLTHPHKDHYGGFGRILDLCEIKKFYYIRNSKNSDTLSELIKKLEKKGTDVVELNGTLRSMLIDELKIIFLWPSEDVINNYHFEDPNDYSLVMFIDYKDFEIVLTGDAGGSVLGSVDLSFIKGYIDGQLDVYKVSHHGSLDGLNKAFLVDIKPNNCVISVGKDNSYGHPSSKVLDFLNEINCKIYQTSVDGNIVFKVI